MVSKLRANGDKTMRTIITLSSLALTLALGLGNAAHARPGDRSRGSAIEQNQNHYLHKRFYRNDQNRARGESSATTRYPDRRAPDDLGAARPEVRKPFARPEPAVWHGPVVRERAQI